MKSFLKTRVTNSRRGGSFRPGSLRPLDSCPFMAFRTQACWEIHTQIRRASGAPPFLGLGRLSSSPVRRRGKVELLLKFVHILRRRRWRRGLGPGAPMAGSEELGLREDTLKVLAAFLKRGEVAGSPVPTSPSTPTQEQPTDFLSRLRRCLPCPLGQGAVPPESPRPCYLPLRPCYDSEPGPATADFYTLVAQRLEQLVQEQLKSPPSPELLGPPPTEKEALLRRLVVLLEEEAEVINQKLASDPTLQRKLARLSMGSFARLAELFSSREPSPRPSRARTSSPCPGPPPPSPEPLARLALAMELSRRVARLGGTLAGLSVEHVHSFAPWIQAHGGWEGILAVSPVDLNLPLD
ncbi:PREDICTED: LOW QUALITY PROTEIN: bcl-2-like protein 12 [Elephantulus edwardii]|uniref:LOW QUALITY PROTEIN: bcl-2-like protein 12 n=1 Tax=Elephantulus edwardii TaxID=28737 RepID=UPI0003F0F281|nr:PREDICTED: LOW QUALITY PROTEIN: bcl-2-like protein 12 [Elephantulus edwardii]